MFALKIFFKPQILSAYSNACLVLRTRLNIPTRSIWPIGHSDTVYSIALARVTAFTQSIVWVNSALNVTHTNTHTHRYSVNSVFLLCLTAR